ncbi:hypothetical protein AXF42_Ash003036 [Apostasia shenzhenica]|uniref:Uncharacterized protein n=1 Tax=Apostasia shenzhenica TaxID=1088818 RepID=A0A2I0A7Z5_9ASPA|nr:hypothetical protein AXF42_Ash003036 [Apostasia shenzhenica]
MDSARPAPPPPPGLGALAKTFTKLVRRRREAPGSGGADDGEDEVLYKPKPSGNLGDFSGVVFSASAPTGGEMQREREALIANVFAGVSAIKAAYAQLQLAQSPYDPDTIQSTDLAIINELKRLSDLKQSFLKNQHGVTGAAGAVGAAGAQIQEQRHLLKTYKITTSKLDSEVRSKDSEVVSLQSELRVAEKRCRALEARLRPGRTLAGLDGLHLSGINPIHFLTLLRSTVKSIRSFVKIMIHEMESSGWDLNAAAGAIQPDLVRRRNPNHRTFAFESYVTRLMFSDFQLQDFGIGGPVRDRLRFFEEFTELKFVKPVDCFGRESQFGKFCKEKYLGLVHPKMEASFFGHLEHRSLVSTGRGWPETDFFYGFFEMARRVWLLHCLFFSFEEKGAIFEARRGARFSEVYMESMAEEEDENAAAEGGCGSRRPVVGFTVVPGFRVGRTVIQCRVFLESRGH